MFRNYFRSALRAISSDRGYSTVNILGLAIGIASCFLMVLFVRHELSFDRYHEHADRMYRLHLDVSAGGAVYKLADTPGPAGPALQESFPEVEVAARVKALSQTFVVSGENEFREERFFYAEPEVFDVFSIEAIHGDVRKTLSEPGSILLTRSIARKYFGDADPIGEVLLVNDGRPFTVGGVVADSPSNTHFRFDFLASFVSLRDVPGEPLDIWGTVAQYYTYFLLAPGTAPAVLEPKLVTMTEQHLPTSSFSFSILPVTDIHLDSQRGNELSANSDIRYVYLFSAIALFILLLACINFTNLATARAASRLREVGVRKVLGAGRKQLIAFFLIESMLFSMSAVLLAALLAEGFLPALNSITGRTLTFSYTSEPSNLVLLIAIGFVVAILAGSYPAVVLSASRPVQMLHGAHRLERGAWLRKGLVVFQFAVSSVLLIGMIVVHEQMRFVQQKHLGFDHDQLLVIELPDPSLRSRSGVLKQILLQDSDVLAAAGSSAIPTGGYSAFLARPEGGSDDESVILPFYWVDSDFVHTYGLELIHGRMPSPASGNDSTRYVLVNESAVRTYGWTEPLGRKIISSDFSAIVSGVVGDFHLASLRQQIEPLAIQPSEAGFTYLTVRLQSPNYGVTLERLEAAWDRFAPNFPFIHRFLDDALNEMYESERRLGRAVTYFCMLAVFIACLGLFALATFTVSRRTKEIGIRKVVGASVSRIVVQLSREFALLVLLGFAVAVPVAYIGLSRWLDDFAYRVPLEPSIFILAGVLVVFIGISAVTVQTVRAALSDPVRSLRYE